jgi:hypothetical protein
MDTEDIGPTFIVGLSAILLAAFFIARHVYLDNHMEAIQSPIKVNASAPQRVIVAIPAAAPSDSPTVLRHVFQCVVQGQRVFSDSQCAPDAKTVAIPESNRMPPPPLVYSPGVDLRGPVRIDDEETEAAIVGKKNCAYIEQAIERLDERMRHGYGSVEGERLHQLHRDLNSQLDDCKRHGR